MIVVAPFKPFPHEIHHEEFGLVWWLDAIRMMRASARASCRCPVMMITDRETTLPFPSWHYVTRERRPALWYLEIACCYLSSNEFTDDTVLLDSDQLVYRDLSPWFRHKMDLGILVRRPSRDGAAIINGVQFWPVRSKTKLADFYERALNVARGLPDSQDASGADTVALVQLLEPLILGTRQRGGLNVRFIDSRDVSKPLSSDMITALEYGRLRRPICSVLDFRHLRKLHMRAVYNETLQPHIGPA